MLSKYGKNIVLMGFKWFICLGCPQCHQLLGKINFVLAGYNVPITVGDIESLLHLEHKATCSHYIVSHWGSAQASPRLIGTLCHRAERSCSGRASIKLDFCLVPCWQSPEWTEEHPQPTCLLCGILSLNSASGKSVGSTLQPITHFSSSGNLCI